MYLEHREFYAGLLAAAQAQLAQAIQPEDDMSMYCEEELWCVAQEVKAAQERVAFAQAEYDDNEESIKWEEEQKAEQCCEYDICWCTEDDEDY